MTKPIVNIWGETASITALSAAQQSQGYSYTAAKPGQLAGTIETDDLDYPMKQVTTALNWMLDGLEWKMKPVGEPFPVRTDIGAPEPPTNNADFRYIKLTASDAYNAGILTNETVSGAAPEVLATAVISLASSPMNGQTIHLINTMGAFVRPGTPGQVLLSQNKSHTHDMNEGGSMGDGVYIMRSTSFTGGQLVTEPEGGDEARPYSVGATWYMRIA